MKKMLKSTLRLSPLWFAFTSVVVRQVCEALLGNNYHVIQMAVIVSFLFFCACLLAYVFGENWLKGTHKSLWSFLPEESINKWYDMLDESKEYFGKKYKLARNAHVVQGIIIGIAIIVYTTHRYIKSGAPMFINPAGIMLAIIFVAGVAYLFYIFFVVRSTAANIEKKLAKEKTCQF